MILKEFLFVCAVSSRTYAYLQALKEIDAFPKMCYILAESKEECEIQRVHSDKDNTYFRIDTNLITLLEKYGIPYQILHTKDANSDQVYEALKGEKSAYVIYSGYGGCILKQRLFMLGKKIIHVHAGLLPEYRGSTTVYYSILKDRCVGATGIFMNEKIDEGDIILEKSFDLPEADVDIDYVYEPWARGQVLAEIVKRYIEDGRLEGVRQKSGGETYFIIHPVLKHLAVLSVKENII